MSMKNRHLRKMGAVLSLALLVLFALVGTASTEVEISGSGKHPRPANPKLQGVLSELVDAYVRLSLPDDADGEYYRVRTITFEDGTGIDEIVINGPPTPPPGYERPVAKIPDKGVKLLAINTLSNVPAFDWSYGCSATSAAMIAGYYDRTGYANMYAGPTNGGVMPLDNSAWGAGECPLSATHQGYDERAIKGHVDDYWISRGSPSPDPFIGSWTEHTYGDCTGDYMKTNQSNYGNVDGSTYFWTYTCGAPLHDYQLEALGPGYYDHDGGYGLKLFYESRGYTVTDMYNQYRVGYDPDGGGPLPPTTQGFTYDQYKVEIDAGRPVMIHVGGHTMVGFGYDDATNLMYIHDTWDYDDHTMTWGGSYSGMIHVGVTIVQLAATEPCLAPPTTPYNPSPADDATGMSINTGLSWSGGHPCPGESVTYDVYFEASNPPTTLICDDVSSATCDPGTLGYDIHYYWKVVANGLNGPSEGPVWDFTTEEPEADLAISKTDDPDPVIPSTPLTYTITVTNTGPSDATGVVVADTLPLTVTFASSSASQGACSGVSTITCDLGTINNGASATVTIVVTPTASGTSTNTASVTSGVTDPNMANNSATASTTACYDFSGNGLVDVADIQAVAGRWRCKCEDACYDPLYDIDDDCDIDIVDIMLVVAHWGETC